MLVLSLSRDKRWSGQSETKQKDRVFSRNNTHVMWIFYQYTGDSTRSSPRPSGGWQALAPTPTAG